MSQQASNSAVTANDHKTSIKTNHVEGVFDESLTRQARLAELLAPPEIKKLIAQIEKIGVLAQKSKHIGDQWTSSLCAPFLNGFLIEMWTTQLAILSTAICNIGDAIEALPPGPGRTFLRRYLHNAAGHYYRPPTEENQNDLSQSAKEKPTPAQASKTSNSTQRPTRGSLVYRHREPRTQYRIGPYPPPRSSSFAPTRCEPNSRRREPET